MNRIRGFTLVELVMVIALAGAIAVMIGSVLSRPMQGFVDQSRRAQLVELATVALSRMARDIRLAVPNSVRVSGGARLELLRSPAGVRYRANLYNGERQNPPGCTASPCAIEVLTPPSGVDLASIQWLVIYNVGGSVVGDNVWPPLDALRSVISPNVDVSLSGNTLILSGTGLNGFRFKYASPQHRLFLADAVVGYDCPGGMIRRKEFSTLSATYDYADAVSLIGNVQSCSFRYDAGTAARGGLVTLQLVLASEEGERISLMQQVHVDNAP
ncbi:MAG: PulJ/GspJ family protein [Pseudomonadales bacterium]|nr:type II secretion system GspH family protein [Alphaproteobacteria bacterium]